MASIFIRTIFIYVILIAMMRFTGKRQIGQLQVSELITAFLMSEIASSPITDSNIPILHAIIPITVILCLEVIASFLSTKSAIIKKFLEGKPSVVVRNGKPVQKEMAKMRMSVEDLFCQLRLKDTPSPAVVDYAIFEPNGQISVFPLENAPTVTGIAHPVIVDGHIISYVLSDIGKDEKWLGKILEDKKIRDIKTVFLMTVDDGDAITVYRKESK